jgi:hypothetical protein
MWRFDMHFNRRNFLELSAGAGMLSFLQGCESNPMRSKDASRHSGVTVDKLEQAAEAPVLRLDGLN